MTVATAKARPKHLNLFQIKLPLPGIVSILHRVSGAGLFLMLPFLLWLLQASLDSPESWSTFTAVADFWLVKLLLLGLLWAFLHHFFAGIRYLVLDLHYGTELPDARASSWAVFAASLPLTAILGWVLW
jgi:succinate dehydrogenase / fumarate reductase cytochrome b subunit